MSQSTTRADPTPLAQRYDKAAGWWGDKMRTLGYHDAYLGFLSSPPVRPLAEARVLDIGCGSGTFAEGWAAIHGAASRISLMDPSRAMLDRAEAALERRGVRADPVQAVLDDYAAPVPFDHLLAAHVLEHCPDPEAALKRVRALVRPGGLLWLVASKPHWCNAIVWLKWRHRAFPPEEVAHMLARTGWQLEVEYAFPSGPPSRTSRGYLARAI